MARRGTTAVQPRFTGSKSALGIAVLAETASRADRAPRMGALWFLRYGSALIPRSGELCAELDAVATLFACKNLGLDSMPHDARITDVAIGAAGQHAWVKLKPGKIVSRDFRKLGSP